MVGWIVTNKNASKYLGRYPWKHLSTTDPREVLTQSAFKYNLKKHHFKILNSQTFNFLMINKLAAFYYFRLFIHFIDLFFNFDDPNERF